MSRVLTITRLCTADMSDYSSAAYEAKKIGTVPPLSRRVVQTLSYKDPGGASTITKYEALVHKAAKLDFNPDTNYDDQLEGSPS